MNVEEWPFVHSYCVFGLKPLSTACWLFFFFFFFSMHGAVKCWRKLGSFVASLPFFGSWGDCLLSRGCWFWVYSFVPTHFVTNISIPVFYCSTILWYCVWFYFLKIIQSFISAGSIRSTVMASCKMFGVRCFDVGCLLLGFGEVYFLEYPLVLGDTFIAI